MTPALESLGRAYMAYVDGYRSPDGRLPAMMELKLVHTMKVVENAKAIAAGENFGERAAVACEAAALLHDTGRYEQLKIYDTFRDSESVDHAVFSHGIVKEKGWLDGWADRDAILFAVLVHNRREIPSGAPGPLALECAKTVRDSDKLDIFRVLEDQLAKTDWRRDCKAFWNLKTVTPPSPAVVDRIREGRPVEYGLIGCLADFVLVQIGWMVSGLEYATSRRLCAARGHLGFRRTFLKELSDSPEIDRLCDLADAALGGSRPSAPG